MDTANDQEQLADDAYVMARLGCTKRFAKRLRDERRIQVFKDGKKVWFTVSGIDQYIKDHTIDVAGR